MLSQLHINCALHVALQKSFAMQVSAEVYAMSPTLVQPGVGGGVDTQFICEEKGVALRLEESNILLQVINKTLASLAGVKCDVVADACQILWPCAALQSLQLSIPSPTELMIVRFIMRLCIKPWHCAMMAACCESPCTRQRA